MLYAALARRVEGTFYLARYGIASFVLMVALVIVHKWLPSGRRRLAEIVPGIVATLVAGSAGRRFGALSRGVLQYLCHHLCGACLGDDRAGRFSIGPSEIFDATAAEFNHGDRAAHAG